jgi:hypothetical protein
MSSWWIWIYTESNPFFEPCVCKCEYTHCSSVVECVRRAAPEDGPLGSKHVVPRMLINSCCIDSRIGIYWLYSRNRMQTLKINWIRKLLSSNLGWDTQLFLLKKIIEFLDINNLPVFYFKDNITETGFCLRLQVEPTQLGPINRASTYLRTPAPTQGRIYKPSKAQIICES